MLAYGFRYYFTPLFGVLFTFPSRYLFAIGLPVVFSLTRWSWLVQTGFLVPRPTQGTAINILPYAYRAVTSFGRLFQNRSAYVIYLISQPYYLLTAETARIWAHSISLAATPEITFVFYSSGYLDVSVPRVCPPVIYGSIALWRWVAPFGYLRINSYLPIPADFRSLSRPSSPPGAKASPVRLS